MHVENINFVAKKWCYLVCLVWLEYCNQLKCLIKPWGETSSRGETNTLLDVWVSATIQNFFVGEVTKSGKSNLGILKEIMNEDHAHSLESEKTRIMQVEDTMHQTFFKAKRKSNKEVD